MRRSITERNGGASSITANVAGARPGGQRPFFMPKICRVIFALECNKVKRGAGFRGLPANVGGARLCGDLLCLVILLLKSNQRKRSTGAGLRARAGNVVQARVSEDLLLKNNTTLFYLK